MAGKTKRIGALIAALVFLGSALATSIFVIWLIATGDSNSSNTTNDTSQTQQESEANPLIGTTLPNFTPTDSVPELKIEDVTVGTGAEATASSTVTVAYVGAFANNGQVFDASPEGQPVTFPLANVIPGWQQGVAGMKVGGTRKLWIPSALAYGEQGGGSIPPNSNLYFEVTLENVQ